MSNFYSSTRVYQPGVMSEGVPAETISVDINELANVIKLDLEAMGYSDVYLSDAIPAVNDLQQLICIRKNYVDFHFMRYDKETDAWYHKPAYNAVLKYNYVPSNDMIWWNEYSKDGVESYDYGVAYDSDIIYIRYSKNQIDTSVNGFQNILIESGKDVFYEINVEKSNHLNIQLVAAANIEYELYNSEFDIVLSGIGDDINECLFATSGKYYLRMNFENNTLSSGVSTLAFAGYDGSVYVDYVNHLSSCNDCGDSVNSHHIFVCDGIEENNHYEVCADCGYRRIGFTISEYITTDENCHSAICSDCGYTYTEEHSFVWKSVDGTSHIMTCDVCGKTTGEAGGHVWTYYTDSRYVRCSICNHLKLTGGGLTPVMPFKTKDSEEESE